MIYFKLPAGVRDILPEESARLVVDGRDEGGLRASSVIAVRRSQTEARFVKVGENRFYERLLSKMNRWGTTA